MRETTVVAGVDVSKRWLDVYVLPSQERWRSANDAEGVDQLARRLARLDAGLVVCEATGGLERLVWAALEAAGLRLAVLNPRRVRRFAGAVGQLAKTDRQDAALLARCGQQLKPEPTPMPSAQRQSLQALVARRRQVVRTRAAERQRLQQLPSLLHEELRRHIAFLDQAVSRLDQQVEALLHDDPRWRRQAELLQSAPGVGPQVTATLLAELPELGRLSTASGSPLRACYQRMRAAGKPANVALTACMRKLLVILNAMLRDQRPWQPA